MEQKPGRYIDPLTDWGFKHLFGSEPNKDVLKSFLNDLFAGEKVVSDIVYSPNEHAGNHREDKKVIFDLYCTGDHGEHFIVEMQRGRQGFFRERSVFYTSRLINEQLSVGSETNTYDLPEVYLIAVLEFTIDKCPGEQYLHDICLMDKDTGEIFYNKLGYKFLALPNFVKSAEELETGLDRWFYLLKNLSRLDKIPKYFDKRIFEKVFQIAEISKLTKEDRMLYDKSLKEKWDYENVLAYAVKEEGEKKYGEGKLEGRLEGRLEGKMEGRLEGKMEGKLEGELAANLKTARNMKKLGLSNSIIAQATGLSLQEIENL